MNTPTRKRHYKPEPSETNAPRQARLRERRKAEGWRRVTVWLSPEQAGKLETLGGDAWPGRTVKQLLGDALQERRPAPKAADTRPAPVAVVPDTGKQRAAFLTPEDKAVLMREVDSLLAQGLSGGDVARKFNAEGRKTIRGAAFTGRNVMRDWRKWKGEK